MNLVYGLALHEFSAGVWEGIGSNPVGDSDFFFITHS